MKVDRASKGIKAGLVVLTGGRHTWVFSEPDENGLRQVYFDGEEEGEGILLGVAIPIALGYITQSSDVEVGRPLGIKFPSQPESERVLISTPVTAIMVIAKKEVVAVSG